MLLLVDPSCQQLQMNVRVNEVSEKFIQAHFQLQKLNLNQLNYFQLTPKIIGVMSFEKLFHLLLIIMVRAKITNALLANDILYILLGNRGFWINPANTPSWWPDGIPFKCPNHPSR